MLRCFVIAVFVGATLASGAAAADGAESDQPAQQSAGDDTIALEPVNEDDTAPNLGNDGDVPLSPVLDDDVAPVGGNSDDSPLEPNLNDDTMPNLPGENLLPESGSDGSKTGRQLQVKIPLRDDGTFPDVKIQRALNGHDSEIWVDGQMRVILKNRPEIVIGELQLVYA
jgi:hypothetical protein